MGPDPNGTGDGWRSAIGEQLVGSGRKARPSMQAARCCLWARSKAWRYSEPMTFRPSLGPLSDTGQQVIVSLEAA
jgi:hypothetical protein